MSGEAIGMVGTTALIVFFLGGTLLRWYGEKHRWWTGNEGWGWFLLQPLVKRGRGGWFPGGGNGGGNGG